MHDMIKKEEEEEEEKERLVVNELIVSCDITWSSSPCLVAAKP